MQNQLLRRSWLFLAKSRAEKKEDKINTDGTVQDLQITKLSLSMYGNDVIIKLRREPIES